MGRCGFRRTSFGGYWTDPPARARPAAHLTRARAAGVRLFTAEVLPVNQRMLEVFRDLGFEEHARFEDGVVRVEFSLEPTARFREAQRRRLKPPA